MTSHSTWARPVALAAGLVTALAGCGQGADAAPAPRTEAVASEPSTVRASTAVKTGTPADTTATTSTSAATTAGTAATTSTGGIPPRPNPEIWKGFRFDDVMDHYEKYGDGKVVTSRRLDAVLPVLCGDRVPVLPPGSPALQLVYEYPEGGTQRGVAATSTADVARPALADLRDAVRECPCDRAGSPAREVTWKIRTEKSGDEAVTLSSVTTASVGGPRSAPLYGTEDVLAVRVGNLLWFGRAVGVSTGRAHFRSPSLAGLLRGFASVEDQLRKRAH